MVAQCPAMSPELCLSRRPVDRAFFHGEANAARDSSTTAMTRSVSDRPVRWSSPESSWNFDSEGLCRASVPIRLVLASACGRGWARRPGRGRCRRGTGFAPECRPDSTRIVHSFVIASSRVPVDRATECREEGRPVARRASIGRESVMGGVSPRSPPAPSTNPTTRAGASIVALAASAAPRENEPTSSKSV
jgi:hypothetical protein